MLEEQFGKGCRSPFLYLEAWKIICKDMTLLHRLNSFWGQVFRFAARRNLLTEELVMRLAYLSGYEKDYNESIYQALAKGYEQYSSEDTLEAICKYVMKGNPRKTEYFRWFSWQWSMGCVLQDFMSIMWRLWTLPDGLSFQRLFSCILLTTAIPWRFQAGIYLFLHYCK